MNWFKRLLGSENRPLDADAEVKASAERQNGSDRGNVWSQPSPSGRLASKPAPNLVDGLNALAEYYRYVEAASYDSALKTAREHRDFRPEFLQRAEAILGYQDDSEACGLIQSAIDKEVAVLSGVALAPVDALEEARRRDPQGFSLLSLTSPLTFESLKIAYRKAALQHHPDVGGDNETMGKINDAYEIFTNILRRKVSEDEVLQQESEPAPANVERFFARVRYTKFAALIDDFDVDAALKAYQALTISEIELQFRPWDTLSRLCQLLAASSRPDEAKRVLHDLGALVELGESRGLILEPVYRKTSEACVDPKAIRFIPNHVRQADNLLKCGVINKKRYDAIIKRVGEATIKLAEDEGAFEEFVQSFKFHSLPMDPPVPTRMPSGLVPAPDYYARVETMTESQRAEYALAFHGGRVELARKYLTVRIDALLRSIFLGYADISAIITELESLKGAPGLKPGLASVGDEALKVASFLASLPAGEFNKRVTALRTLDATPSGTIRVLDPSANSTIIWPRPILPNPSYTAFATGPMKRIELYMKTGSELDSDEAAEARKKWFELRAFHESETYERAREATWREKDPEKIVAAVAPLCDAMYSRAANDPDTSLEIGYWTDKLTIALVKLKRFQDALRWIHLYEEAPPSIKSREANGVLEALSKRKARCESALRS